MSPMSMGKITHIKHFKTGVIDIGSELI